MKTNKILVVTVILLVVALIAESAYLIYARSKENEMKQLQKLKPPKRGLVRAGHDKAPFQPPKKQNMQMPNPGFVSGDIADTADWDPFSEMDQIQRRMNRLFQESMNRAQMDWDESYFSGDHFFEPDIDIRESNNQYVIKLDLPGMDKDKISVTVSNQMLVVSGERKIENEQNEDGKFYRVERSYGSFERSIPLPDNADTQQVNAEYQNGVLIVTLPKLKENTESKKPESKIKVV